MRYPFYMQWWPGSVCIDPPLHITKTPQCRPGPLSTSWPVEVRRPSLNVEYNCQTYLPFSDEVTLSIHSGCQDLCALIHHYAFLRLPNAIPALCPPAIPHFKPASGHRSPYRIINLSCCCFISCLCRLGGCSYCRLSHVLVPALSQVVATILWVAAGSVNPGICNWSEQGDGLPRSSWSLSAQVSLVFWEFFSMISWNSACDAAATRLDFISCLLSLFTWCILIGPRCLLARPVNSLRLFQKGAYYSAIQIYNKLPDYIKLLCFEHKCSSFKNSLKKFLLTHTFYNMEEFYSYNLDWKLLFVCVCLSHDVFYILEHMLVIGSIEQDYYYYMKH